MIFYVRSDGIIARYFPDFMVQSESDIYIIETKAQKDINNIDVLSKKRAALDYMKRINELPSNQRGAYTWHYAIISDKFYYTAKNDGANIQDLIKLSCLTSARISMGQGNLLDTEIQ